MLRKSGKLQQLPLVKEAAVTKLYPDRLLIEIEERHPSPCAVRRQVLIVAADAYPSPRCVINDSFIAARRGRRANEKLSQYMALLDTRRFARTDRGGSARREAPLDVENGKRIEILLPERTERRSHGSSNFNRRRIFSTRPYFARSPPAKPPCARLTEEAAAERARRFPEEQAKGGHL